MRAKVLQSYVVALQDTTRARPPARAIAMYLSRTLGEHKLTDVGEVLGIGEVFVGEFGLFNQGRMEREKRLAGRVGNVERLLKSQQQS